MKSELEILEQQLIVDIKYLQDQQRRENDENASSNIIIINNNPYINIDSEYTVKAFVVTPQNDKKFHNFKRGLRQRL